MNLGLYDPNTH